MFLSFTPSRRIGTKQSAVFALAATLLAGLAQPAAACQSDADCTEPASPYCVGSFCQAAPPCTSDADCTDPARPKCVAAACVQPPGGCTSDADCTDPSNPSCIAGVCGQAAGPACQSDADCTDPANPYCASGNCTPGRPCVSDADCTDPSAPSCVAGFCSATASECLSDADCPNPAAPSCVAARCTDGLVPTDRYDHMRCYKIKDSARFSALATLRTNPAQSELLPDEYDCRIVVRSQELCVPVAKDSWRLRSAAMRRT
jgi:hypothetical protein